MAIVCDERRLKAAAERQTDGWYQEYPATADKKVADNQVPDKIAPYLGAVDASEDETGTVGKPSLSAFKRCRSRPRRRSPRRDTAWVCQGPYGYHSMFIQNHQIPFPPGSLSSGATNCCIWVWFVGFWFL